MQTAWGSPNYGAILERRAVDRPSDTFLLGPDGGRTSYRDFRELTGRAAGALRDRGVARGDRVVTICQNQLGFFAAAYATWALGAILVPLNHEQRRTVLSGMLQNAAPALILVDGLGWNALASLPEGDPSRAVAVADVAGLLDGSSVSMRIDAADPGEPALILYSSGTTGVSKGCTLSHEHLVYTGEEFRRAADLVASDAIYSPGPMFHSNSWWAFSGAVVGGVQHAFDIRFSASQFWAHATAAEATLFDYVGAMISILLRTPQGPGADCRIRAGLGGGARPQEVHDFRERFHLPLLECYGLTECCLPLFQSEAELRVGSIGRLSDYFDARLVDDKGVDSAAGSSGEL